MISSQELYLHSVFYNAAMYFSKQLLDIIMIQINTYFYIKYINYFKTQLA